MGKEVVMPKIEIINMGEKMVLPIEDKGMSQRIGFAEVNGIKIIPEPHEYFGFILSEKTLNDLGLYFRKKKAKT